MKKKQQAPLQRSLLTERRHLMNNDVLLDYNPSFFAPGILYAV